MPRLVLGPLPREPGQGPRSLQEPLPPSCCSLAGMHTTAPGELRGQGEQTERIAVIPACSVDSHNQRLWPTDVKTLLFNCECFSQA